MSNSVEASVIIPTLRADEDLQSCLKSIAGNISAPEHEVIIVFNAPVPDDFVITLNHMKARAVQADSNLGFAEGCNLGARNALGEILVFLNDDMTVQAEWMGNLVKPIQEKEFPATGGRILSEDGKKIDFDGASINLLGWGFQKGHGESVQTIDDEFGMREKLPFACGGNFAVRADIFENVGGFDEDYFAFYEDVDLGWRMRLMGLEIGYSLDAVVHHNTGATGDLIPAQIKWFLQERNTLQTIIKNYSDDFLWQVLPIAFALVGIRAQILSDIEVSDVLDVTYWRETILGKEKRLKEESGIIKGLVDGVKESLKSSMKGSRKSGLGDGYLPIDSRGAAGLLALEWCMNNWDALMEKRSHVQEKRIVEDRKIFSVFDDLFRPVLGHPREVEAMKPLEDVLNKLMSE